MAKKKPGRRGGAFDRRAAQRRRQQAAARRRKQQAAARRRKQEAARRRREAAARRRAAAASKHRGQVRRSNQGAGRFRGGYGQDTTGRGAASRAGRGGPPPPSQEAGDGLAQPVANPGSRGQNMKYWVGPGSGLWRDENGNWTDGTYHYDDNGLSLDRPDSPVQGLPPADSSEDYDVWSGKGRLGTGGGRGGGGGGGAAGMGYGSIPGAGTYLFEQAMAQGAYDAAIAALEKQRAQRQSAAGLRGDWTVDPLVMYGGYQQMLRGQGQELNAADYQAAERGLLGAGLGRQAETEARYGHSVQNKMFKQQLSDWENEYQQGKAAAEYEKQMSWLNSLQGGYDDAYGDWGYDDNYYDPNRVNPFYKGFFNPSSGRFNAGRGRPTRRRGSTGFGGALGYNNVRRRQQQRNRPVPPKRRFF